MADTTTYFNNITNNNTKDSTDTDEIIESYIKCLNNIYMEDEDYQRIIRQYNKENNKNDKFNN